MAVQIPRSALQKLTHNSSEIRMRTLEQTEAKFERALTHNEHIEFNPSFLCKQLIRWFGYTPLQGSCRVLKFLLKILQSKYGESAVQQIGIDRFVKELGKVEILMKKKTEELEIVYEIQQILSKFQQESEDDLVEIISTLNLNEEIERGGAARELLNYSGCSPSDYEVAWSRPNVADYNTMKFLADVFLSSTATDLEVESTLQHLQITIHDYPPEYMLQSPNIFLSLLQLYDRAEETHCSIEDISRTFLVYLKMLKQSLKLRQKSISYAVKYHHEGAGDVQANTQLKVGKALKLLLEKCVNLMQFKALELRAETIVIYELVLDILIILKMQHLCVDKLCLIKLHGIIVTLKEYCEQEDHFTIQRMKYLLTTFLLEDIAANNAERQPFEDVQLLEPLLRDYVLRVHFPERSRRLENLLFNIDSTIKLKYSALGEFEDAISIAMSLLSNPECRLNGKQIIEKGEQILTAVEKLKSSMLINIIFDSIIQCNSLYPADESLRNQALDVLVKLLCISYEPLKEVVYKRLSQAFKKHFACLMNGEYYCDGINNAQLLSAHIIGVPLNIQLLVQLTHETYEGTNIQIKRICEDILMLCLKSKHLLGTQWGNFLSILLPIVPLLQCCVYSPKMTNLLLQLFDPDASNVPFLEILKGNIGFLFHPHQETRSEALTRLIFILNTLQTSGQYLPNIMEISDVLPNDICILEVPRHYNRIFISSEADSNIVSIMHNLFSILEAADIEPLIRKTTLMQLYTMCQNWEATMIFCNEAASYLVLQAFENSMKKSSFSDYTDAAIPAIGILSKVFFYDSELRQELSSTPNIYVLLLRALFLYQHDIQVRQDASLCLFQLLFSSFLVVLGSSGVEVPSIVSNIKLPVMADFKRCNEASNPQDKLRNIFPSILEEEQYLRHLIAAKVYGPKNITKKYLEMQKEFDLARELHLTNRDWRFLKSSNPEYNVKRFMIGIANATDHTTVINATLLLRLQLFVIKYNPEGKISDEISNELFQLFGHYLRMAPGNEMDLLLFENMVDFFDLCTRFSVTGIVANFSKTLQMDFQHAILTLLKSKDIPLRLYNKLSKLLVNLLKSTDSFKSANIDPSIFFSNLFEYLIDLVDEYVKQRDLQRARCLLIVLQNLGCKELQMPDKFLFNHCKRVMQFSITLKSSTQTGARWHRDCLQLLCHLFSQMAKPSESLKFPGNIIRYASGLCGHHDTSVRALAWCVLGEIVQARESDNNSARIVLTELSYLPGGFLACCLCTLLDPTETIMVRQLAGNLFVLLLTPQTAFDEIMEHLSQQRFFQVVSDSLEDCMLDEELPLHFDYTSSKQLVTCELISCFSLICIKLVELHPNYMQELCEKTFMRKLYEIMKIPQTNNDVAYYNMCANIFQLYGLCYTNNFTFLQRTLCRDQLWIASFCNLMDHPIADNHCIITILQFLLILSKDDYAYGQLCEKFEKAAQFLVKLFLKAFNIPYINSSLQRAALTTLKFMLIKSQSDDTIGKRSFATILEEANYVIEVATEDNKENDPNIVKQQNIMTSKISLKDSKENITNAKNNKTSPSVLLFNGIHRLFVHLYPMAASKFESLPSPSQVQISDTISILLKVSPEAQKSAHDLKFLEKILNILETFFQEFNTSCTTFVRRYGELKKMAVIKNIQLLLNILLHWYSTQTSVITSETKALRLTKVLTQIWPWLSHSFDLKYQMLQVCAFLSEHSLIISQQFSETISNQSTSILQLVLKIVNFETTKVKALSSDTFPIIEAGLRVVINCCSCVEGRSTLIKCRTLDIFDYLHPFNMKSPKIKGDILHAWLQFWELFTRYSEGAQVRNLNSLCEVINRSSTGSPVRLLCLKILRNMSFLAGNRSALITSNDFIYTVNEIIMEPINNDQQTSYEEQLIVCVSIWKIISTGIKYVAMIRGTKLAKRFLMLREYLNAKEDTSVDGLKESPFTQDLANVLDVIFSIFNDRD